MSAVAGSNRREIVLPITRNIRIAGLIVALLLVIGGVGLGAFLIGQGTRKSDAQVAHEQHTAVTKAVAARAASDHAFTLQTVAAHVATQKAHDRKLMHNLALRLKRQANKRAEQAFSRGSSAGYASGNSAGYAAGTENGLEKGSDQLTCSDDPDVYWLPACNF